MLRYRILIGFLRILSLLPLNMARSVGKLLSYFACRLSPRMLATTRTNLAICLPELDRAERETLARASIRHTFMTIAESGAVWLWPRAKIARHVYAVEGEELLRAALAEGNGVIIIGPHLGNWELLGLYLTRYGPCTQLFLPPASGELDRLLLAARSRGGATMVPTDAGGVAALLKALRRGEMTGILPDQVPPPGAGDFAPFFGREAYTMTLLPRLLRRTGAKALVGIMRRENHGFTLVFREPAKQIYAKHMPTALAALNRSVEDAVRTIPEQYQWEYKRFRRQPEGAESPY